ncbi:hypothetical protein KY309_00205 [Candidatus Woesearchaeota archaeon]|nr:hypothetical protein [Candidatus Woesearchaeota archaeon]
MKKLFILLLLMALPVLADSSNMHDFLGATSDAGILTTHSYGGASAETRGDYTPSDADILIDVNAYAFDFDASTNTVMPGYPNFARIFETGKSDTVSFVDAVFDGTYFTGLYQKGNNGVVFSKNKDSGVTVAVKELARNDAAAIDFNGMIFISPGEYFAYGTSGSTFYGMLFAVSGATYSITASKTISIGNGLADNQGLSAVYDSYADVIVLCGISTDEEAPQCLACVILDAADLTPDDSVDWTIPNPVGYDVKVAAYISGTGDTRLDVAEIGDVGGSTDVYHYSVDVVMASDSFAVADNWQKKGSPGSGVYTQLTDLLVDDDNNFVSIQQLLDTQNYGVIASLDYTDGSTAYTQISGAAITFNDLCRVTSTMTGIAAYDSTFASATIYLLDKFGFVQNARKTTAGGGASGNALACADVLDPVTSAQLVGIGGAYDDAINQHEALFLFNVGTDNFVAAVYMTYDGLGGTKPDKVYKVLSDADDTYYFSNQGVGGQDFGISSPVSGEVPEFSIVTLLLAVLLAGGLLFVIRRRAP